MSKIDDIKLTTINLVANALHDEDLTAAKRAELALKLLSNQEINEIEQNPEQKTDKVEIIFKIVDTDSTIIEQNTDEMPERSGWHDKPNKHSRPKASNCRRAHRKR